MNAIYDIQFFLSYDPNKILRKIPKLPIEFYEGADWFAGTTTKNMKLMKNQDQKLALSMGSLNQYGFSICLNKADSSIHIQIDPYAIYPIFLTQFDDGSYLVTNSTFSIHHFAPDQKLNINSVKTFFSKGYLFPHQTFIKNCFKITKNITLAPGSKNYFSNTDCIWPIEAEYTSEDLDSSAQITKVISLFQKSLTESLPINIPGITFQMSGGADSRLISLMYLNSNLKHPNVETAESPWMKDQFKIDLDSTIAEKWCQKISVPYKIRTLDPVNKDYLPIRTGEPSISGMLGGDYWGGTYQKSLPTEVDEFSNELGSFLDDSDELEQYIVSLKKKSINELSAIKRQIFVQSDRSTIFGNIATGFSCPSGNSRRSYSPFLSKSMMNLFLKCDDSFLCDYKFYIQVLKASEQNRHFPICSYLNSITADWDAPISWGENPKLFTPSYKFSHPNEWQEKFDIFIKLLHDHFAEVNIKKIYTILENPKINYIFQGRMYSFLYALNHRFFERYY